MGLDMYLSATINLSKYSGEELAKKGEEIRLMFPEMFRSGNLESVEVNFEAGYWRKANQIHKWFVDNVQDGEDECKPHYVSREDLEKLKAVCKQVLKDPKLADEFLPGQEGFFFGGTEYGKYYLEELKETIKIINKCLKLPEAYEFEYRSSW